MWVKKVQHKNQQMFLTGVMLFAVAGLLNMSLCLLGELASFSKHAINEQNCPDGYVFTIGTKNFRDNFENNLYQSVIRNAFSLSGKTVTAPIRYNGKDITQLYDMMLSGKDWQAFEYLELRSGNANAGGPGVGEVWLSEVLTTPNNIELGDKITIQYTTPLELTVTGVYRSTCFPKGIGYSPMLVNQANLEQTQNEKDAALFAVNIKNYSSDNLKALFQNSSYSVATRSRDDVQSSLMEYSAPLGAVGAMASLTFFVLAMVILWYIINSNLMKEYHTIGVYKSLGYTSNDITQFYIVGYVLVGFIAVAIGAFSSLKLVQVIGDMLTEYVDDFRLTNASFIISLITILSVIILLYANLKIAFRKIKVITPVEALSVGTTGAEQKLPQSVLKYARTPMAMAINELFKYKKATVMTVLAVAMSMFLSMLFQMIWYSADTILENRNLWFSMPKSDVYVVGNISDDLQNYLQNNSYVKSAVYGDFMIGYCKPEGYQDAPDFVGYDAYSDFSEGITGVRMLQGHGPKNKNEVAVGMNLLSMLHLGVGDPITLTLNGITKEYTISGTYETISDRGRKIMLTTEAVAECKDYSISRVYVQLNHAGNYENFKKDIEDKFAGIAVNKEWFAMENSVESIRSMLKSISMVFIIAFFTFSILNVLIILTMNIKNWRKKYGVMKTLGFTSDYFIQQNINKFFVIAVISSIVSLGLHLFLSRRIAAFLLIDAFVNSNRLIGLIIFGFIVLILLTTYFISLSVNKISPLELMEE